eukprot:scaffold1634_cov118-Skeletonema_dohrnii-CCMP3373.AAC.13
MLPLSMHHEYEKTKTIKSGGYIWRHRGHPSPSVCLLHPDCGQIITHDMINPSSRCCRCQLIMNMERHTQAEAVATY